MDWSVGDNPECSKFELDAAARFLQLSGTDNGH
jgi:hypothetical protein